ncbi:MAG: hypothetical protein JNK87_18880 [Bryobacterales bacterium]|nr:hypothetical protein [Bryobacterales bacterium]
MEAARGALDCSTAAPVLKTSVLVLVSARLGWVAGVRFAPQLPRSMAKVSRVLGVRMGG